MTSQNFSVRSTVAVAAIAAIALATSAVPTVGASARAAKDPEITADSFRLDFSAMSALKGVAKEGTGNIAVLLPGTPSSARYVSFDEPFLTRAFETAGLSSRQFEVYDAQGSALTMHSQAQAAVIHGASVLVVDPLDSVSGAAIEVNAREQGVKVIDYDHLTLHGRASYFVGFDEVRAGELLGEGLTRCVASWGVASPRVLEIGGDPTDRDASQLAEGYDSVLDTRYERGDYERIGEPVGTWHDDTAQTYFAQQLAARPDVNAVLAASDALANSVISVLKNNQVPVRTIPTTGRGATVIGLRNILDGYQCMTVYEPVYVEAQAAVVAALYVRAGRKVPRSLVRARTDNRDREVPSILLPPLSVTAANIASTVVRDGLVPVSTLCEGSHAAACAAAGIDP
jgi:D-xylose transport system substrate-binding protein